MLTNVWMIAENAIVLNRPRKVSATKPPSRQRRKEVPMKSVTMLAEVALG